MRKVVVKYTLESVGEQVITIPVDSQILTIAYQNGKRHIWAQVDPSAESVGLKIITLATGESFDWTTGSRAYIGSTFETIGQQVFHHWVESKAEALLK